MKKRKKGKSQKRSGLRRIFWILLALFLILNALAAIHAWRFTHFTDEPGRTRRKPDAMSPTEKFQTLLLGMEVPRPVNDKLPSFPYRTVYLLSEDDIQLQGWYSEVQPSKGSVVLCHGYGGSKSEILAEAEWFHRNGYTTLMIDLRAHGGSKGNVCTIGYDEAADVAAAYQFFRNRGQRNIVLWGTSLGAASIMHAVQKHELKPEKIILEMPFASLHEAVQARVRVMGAPAEPIASLLTFWGGVELGFWGFGHKPADYAKSIRCPTLLQWGVHDNRVSAAETEAIYTNLASGSRKLVLYKRSGHQSLLRNEPLLWDLEMRSFLK